MTVELNLKRDIALLQFIWLWKICSTKALAQRFFALAKTQTAYKRIMKLYEGGFIVPISDSTGHGRVWTLTQKGYRVVRPGLPELKEEGFASEHILHDIIVSAVQVGEFLIQQPNTVEIFSEQQLRRYAVSQYPLWVPKDFDRRPDGYWHIKSTSPFRTIALEIELNAKAKADYQHIVSSYAFKDAVTDVLWVVEKPWLAKMIHKLARDNSYNKGNKHSFILVGDFIQNGWNSKIVLGKCLGQTVFDLLMLKSHARHTHGPLMGVYRKFFELQKSHRIPKVSEPFSLREFT